MLAGTLAVILPMAGTCRKGNRSCALPRRLKAGRWASRSHIAHLHQNASKKGREEEALRHAVLEFQSGNIDVSVPAVMHVSCMLALNAQGPDRTGPASGSSGQAGQAGVARMMAPSTIMAPN